MWRQKYSLFDLCFRHKSVPVTNPNEQFVCVIQTEHYIKQISALLAAVTDKRTNTFPCRDGDISIKIQIYLDLAELVTWGYDGKHIYLVISLVFCIHLYLPFEQ